MKPEMPQDRAMELAKQQALDAAKSVVASETGAAPKQVLLLDSDPTRLVVDVPRNYLMWMQAIGGLFAVGYLLLYIWEPLSSRPGLLLENVIPFFRGNLTASFYFVCACSFLVVGFRGLRSVIFGERYVIDQATRTVSRGRSVLTTFDDIEMVELRHLTPDDRFSYTPRYCLQLHIKDGKTIDLITVDLSGGLNETAQGIARMAGVPIRTSQ